MLLPLNEPTFGTAKKSQIQTFLEQNDGPGLQHMVILILFRHMLHVIVYPIAAALAGDPSVPLSFLLAFVSLSLFFSCRAGNPIIGIFPPMFSSFSQCGLKNNIIACVES